jgi:hypothetical protein
MEDTNMFPLNAEGRELVVNYKRAYIALRTSHAALVRNEGTLTELAAMQANLYLMQDRCRELAVDIPADVVASIEYSIDRAYGFAVGEENMELARPLRN